MFNNEANDVKMFLKVEDILLAVRETLDDFSIMRLSE